MVGANFLSVSRFSPKWLFIPWEEILTAVQWVVLNYKRTLYIINPRKLLFYQTVFLYSLSKPGVKFKMN